MLIVAIYWHFVDAVWLAVFFTFYLTPTFGDAHDHCGQMAYHPIRRRHAARFPFGCCSSASRRARPFGSFIWSLTQF